MPWRSWCRMATDPDGTRRVMLLPPSVESSVRLIGLMCGQTPDADEVAIALIHDFGRWGIAEVTGPAEHLTKIRACLPDWMVADSDEELLQKLPQAVPVPILLAPSTVPRSVAVWADRLVADRTDEMDPGRLASVDLSDPAVTAWVQAVDARIRTTIAEDVTQVLEAVRALADPI